MCIRDSSEGFFQKLEELEGIRVPGERRHKNRLDLGARNINKELLEKLRDLLEEVYP